MWSATFVRTNVVSATFVETPPEWLLEGSTGVALRRVSSNVLLAIFVRSTAMLATLARTKVLLDTLMLSSVTPAILMQSKTCFMPVGARPGARPWRGNHTCLYMPGSGFLLASAARPTGVAS